MSGIADLPLAEIRARLEQHGLTGLSDADVERWRDVASVIGEVAYAHYKANRVEIEAEYRQRREATS